MGQRIRCLLAPRKVALLSLRGLYEPPLLDPPDVTKALSVRMLRPTVVSKTEFWENACLDMNGIQRNESDATTSEDKASARVCRKRRRLITSNGKTLRTKALLSGTSRSKELRSALQEFLRHTLVANNALVADTEVDKGLVAFLNEKYHVVCSSSTGDILLGVQSTGNNEGTFCHAAIVPSKVGGSALLPEAEILTFGAYGQQSLWII